MYEEKVKIELFKLRFGIVLDNIEGLSPVTLDWLNYIPVEELCTAIGLTRQDVTKETFSFVIPTLQNDGKTKTVEYVSQPSGPVFIQGHTIPSVEWLRQTDVEWSRIPKDLAGYIHRNKK